MLGFVAAGPGLAATNDRTFIVALQSTNRAINNPWFIGGTFLGSLGLTVAGDPDTLPNLPTSEPSSTKTAGGPGTWSGSPLPSPPSAGSPGP